VALTWRLQATGGDQARRSLNLADIVAAAMAIADEEGLAEISMAKIAKRLGYSTMALYRHVPGKPELIELMFDAGVGAPDDDTLVPGDWRESLARMARQMSAMYRGRRWRVDIPSSGPPASPNNLLGLETGLQALRDTPLSVQERAA
jgi:AcrR family transcriptional regulator